MPVITGVSNQLRRPQTFHTFSYSFAIRSLVPLPLRVALVGMMLATGTANANEVYEITDGDQADELFGASSEVALMCRKALETAARIGRGPKIFAVGIAEPGAGTANVQTITVGGAATADGNAKIRIAGRPFSIGITNGDAAADVAAAIADVLKAKAETLPVIATVAGPVVTLTHPHKGVNGKDVVVSIDEEVAGATLAVATTAVGAGDADAQPALDALGPLPFDGIAIGNHAAQDITDVNEDLALRWQYAAKRWRWYFLGEMGTLGTATALAAAANHHAVLIASMEGCLSTAGEMATALAVGAFSRERPNANYDGMSLPLYPPAASVIYEPDEIETAIEVGLTPLTAIVNPFTRTVADATVRVERMVTTKAYLDDGVTPYEVLRDLAVSRTGVYIAQQIDAWYRDRFGENGPPDGALLTDDTIDQIKDGIEVILRAMEEGTILRNVEADLPQLVVERDGETPGRTDSDIPYTVVVGQHQLANRHRVQI